MKSTTAKTLRVVEQITSKTGVILLSVSLALPAQYLFTMGTLAGYPAWGFFLPLLAVAIIGASLVIYFRIEGPEDGQDNE